MNPPQPFGRTVNRILFGAALVGLALFVGGLAANSEFLFLGLLLASLCAALLLVTPAIALALPSFRARPASERVVLRVPALLSGVVLIAAGAAGTWRAMSVAGVVVGLLLTAAGAWALAQAIALPRVPSVFSRAATANHTGVVLAAGFVLLLVAIVVPKFAGTKERAYVAAMRSDLSNLLTAEEAYFADSNKFTTDLGEFYYPTSGVQGPTIILTSDGYTATVGHTTTVHSCAIFVGSTRLPPAVSEGVAACDDRPPRDLPSRALMLVGLVVAAAAGFGVSKRTPPQP